MQFAASDSQSIGEAMFRWNSKGNGNCQRQWLHSSQLLSAPLCAVVVRLSLIIPFLPLHFPSQEGKSFDACIPSA